MKKNLFAILFGLLFGLGLSLSKMTDPQVVLDFFDIVGNFNPMLLFVFIAALSTTIIGYKLILKRDRPLIDAKFHIPEKLRVDMPLIAGALLFGIGWGISGYCPAPVLGILFINPKEFFVFALPMIIASNLLSVKFRVKA